MLFFYIKTCSNIDIISSDKQRTLMKRFVSTALWPMVELNRADSWKEPKQQQDLLDL